MQNKGAIRLFALLLAAVCIYYLSFTLKTYNVKRDAQEYAQGDLTKENAYLDSMKSEPIYNLGFRKYTFGECQEREINLGLDLKGGMNVMLEVSVVDVIKSLSGNNKDTTFLRALVLTKQLQQNSQKDFVTLFGEAFEQIDPNARLAAIFNTIELREKINFNSTNEEVIKVIKDETEGAIDNAFNIISTRIDRFGVVQPTIQKLETSGRILVELPGVKDQARVKKLLQGTANLEFWETYENSEIFPALQEANKLLKEMQEIEEETKTVEKETPVETESISEKITPEETTDQPVSLLNQLEEDTTDQSVSLIDQLEEDTLTTEPATLEQFNQENPLFGVLRPLVSADGIFPGPAIGRAHYRDTAKVNEYMSMKQIKALFPHNFTYKWSIKPPKNDQTKSYYELIAIKTGRDGLPPLDGDVITSAREDFGQNQATAQVDMAMNGEGSKIWARLTKANEGKSIAIVLDGYVYSNPRVNEEIKGGRSQITGDFTITEAKDLANVLKSGKLPAPARIIQEEIVGPSLGQESINSGLKSFLIAFIVVLLYMIFYYSRQAGLVANIALITNVFFIMGVLSSLGAVLTLPGIAGIILTIGMAVDANVLIYERIREELTAGKGLKLAVSDGYKNAYSAIIDSNVTTLLTGFILYIFGTGPIKGFATTLVIGILTSLFSAIFISRLIFLSFLNRNKSITFSTRLTKGAFKNTKIKFLSLRKMFYIVSAILITISIYSLITRGLNFGVDFKGGRSYVVRFADKVSTIEVQQLLKNAYGEAPEVKIFGKDNQVKVTTKYKIDEDTADEEVETKLYNGLKPLLADDVTPTSFHDNNLIFSQKVGATIADDIKVEAFWAIFFALVIIFIYILIRFRGWQYSLGAVAALVHDSIFVLGIFSLLYGRMPFSLEIDQAFIAAILTVVGYSINDSVVVFDRIREYITLYPKRDRPEIIDSALNSTLSRTINTSFTTLFVLFTIFLLGGEVIRGFAFALLIGIGVGTYSSLFIATPIAFDTARKVEKKVDKSKTPKKK